ncbi:MAG TPA: hypothetical protein VJ944_05000 [Thermoplasmataceae archaeon]|nr:hypothetical protein [Thermoplasmataceae archaeon]
MTENRCDVCGMSFGSKESLMEHAKMHMGSGNTRTGPGKLTTRGVITSSVVGGILGGIVMLIVLMVGAMGMGLSATTFAMVMGMGLGASMGAATAVGVVSHFVVAIVAGGIFGAIVSFVKPLGLKTAGRAPILGLVFGIVMFLVFFLPMAMAVFAPVMMHLMDPKAAMMLPDVLVTGFIGHILFGLVLGTVAFYFGRKF